MRTAQNALRPSRHDSPNDPLRGHSDYVAFEGPKHCVDSPSSLSSLTVARLLERPAGFEPAFTSFVAKAINPLWHGRSNVGRGTQNRTESTCSQGTDATHYTIPRWCQPSELNAALSVFSGAYRPRIRDWRNLVDLVGSAPTTSALQVRRSP